MRRNIALALAIAALTGCSDPVRDSQIDALGDEQPGVPEGPLHRPGQPCMLCHGGDGPGDSVFSFAGTVYQTQASATPLADALVRLVDANGRRFETGTNCAGNFFVMRSDYAPAFPVWTKVIFGHAGPAPVEQEMSTPMYREGSCNQCHRGDPASESTGRIYFAPEGAAFPPPGCPR